MKVLRGSVPYTASELSQTLKWEKETAKSTAPEIYKHNRGRELQAGVSARGRSKATSDLSVHTHTNRHWHTLIFSELF